MSEKFVFDGIDSSTYGVHISGESVYNAPEREYEFVDIMGRNGQLAIDHERYQNIEVTYPAFIYGTDQADFTQKIDSFRSALLAKTGYKRLTDTYHPNEYRMGIFISGLEVDPVWFNGAGDFDLTFNCKPQRFLVSGETETTLTSGNNVVNPTPYPSRPLFKVVGAGTLTVGSIAITIADNDTKYIDCDTMECYAISGGDIVSKNNKIVLTEFPTLSGTTNISWTGLTSVKVTPRWWTL